MVLMSPGSAMKSAAGYPVTRSTEGDTHTNPPSSLCQYSQS